MRTPGKRVLSKGDGGSNPPLSAPLHRNDLRKFKGNRITLPHNTLQSFLVAYNIKKFA